MSAVEKLLTYALANPTSMPVTLEMVTWARCRPAAVRTPIPEAGDRVWYRHEHHGPVTTAEVERVDMSNTDDYGVWKFVLDGGQPVMVGGQRLMELVDDPWPDVWLRTDWGRVVTRESRIDGSAGWLPMMGKV